MKFFLLCCTIIHINIDRQVSHTTCCELSELPYILICIWPGVRKLRIAYHFSLLVDIRLNKGWIFLNQIITATYRLFRMFIAILLQKSHDVPADAKNYKNKLTYIANRKQTEKKINMGDRLKELKERSLKRKELLAKAVRFFGFYWMS